MKRLFQALKPATKRYVTIGVIVYGFELVVIVVAQHYKASSVVAVGLSFWLGLILSFFLQKFITFQDRRMQKRIVVPQFLALLALVLFNFGFTLLLSKLLKNYAPAVFIRTVALGITTIWNFYLYKTRIFRKTEIDLID